MDSLPGVMHHLTDAWRRRDDGNVVLVHYEDLQADLAGQMRRLADRLRFDVRAEALARARGGGDLRGRCGSGRTGSPRTRSGSSRTARRSSAAAAQATGAPYSSAGDLARYEQRAAALAPADLLAWLHRG